MTSQQGYFSTYYPDSTTVTLANNSIVKAAGRGDVVLLLPSGDITLKDVLHIPSLGFSSLLSLRLIHQSGCQIVFNQAGSGPPNGDFEGADHVMHILNGPDIIATVTLIGHSYVLHTKRNPVIHAAFATASVPIRSSPIQHPSRRSADSLFQWHLRLGHIGFEGIKQLAKDPACGIKLTSTAIEACAACLQGKQTRHPSSKPAQRASNTLDRVHSDLCGPMTPQSLGGAKYYICFRDDATSWMELEPIKKKSDAFGSIKKYFARCEVMHGVKIKAFRSDNGGEFTSHALEEFLASSGCKHEVSAAYSQEQNGVAERVNRTIVGRAKAILYGAQLPLFLWAEAARTAVYIMNRTPTRSQMKTPYELWTGKPAQSLVHLQPFGCEIWHHVTKDLRRKWEPNEIKGHLVGYEGRNQYRVYCNHSIIITRDVNFVPPAPAAALYPPVEIIKEDEEEDSGVALKPSKADLQAATPPPPADETNRSQGNEETLYSIIIKAPATRTAVNDEAAREVVGTSRRQSSRKNAGTFSTP